MAILLFLMDAAKIRSQVLKLHCRILQSVHKILQSAECLHCKILHGVRCSKLSHRLLRLWLMQDFAK